MLVNTKWSKTEKQLARKAFDDAYIKCCKEIRRKAEKMLKESDCRSIWKLHDYLSEMKQETDSIFDYRYSVLIRVLGKLVEKGYLSLSEMEGLEEDKIEHIRMIAKPPKWK